jgi:glycosyltransferase involved in cell wall biosynthesis
MIRLSIIVPFYNVDKYIEECIRSLYDQDIPQEEYEVICVDDCSPDRSRAIVDRLQKEYPSLRLLTHMENKRQGGARNTGLREAKGKYVWFVDSDDYIMPNCLKSLLDQVEKENLEILQFDYVKGKQPMLLQEISNNIMSGEEYLFGDGASLWYDKVIGPWRQIFKRQFLTDNQLQFVEGVQFEDTDYILKVFINARMVQHMPLKAYGYRFTIDSTTYQNLSPLKLAWRVNQISRCVELMPVTKTKNAKKSLGKMATNAYLRIRDEIKLLNWNQKCEYIRNLRSKVSVCKTYVNWRTWLAIRYGVTWFI